MNDTQTHSHAHNGRSAAADHMDCSLYEAEYSSIHNQRINLIRTYNFWYAFGLFVSLSSYWLAIHFSLQVGSLPLMVAGGVIATVVVLFAFNVVRNIDRDVVALYPRIVFLELMMGYDFYRDFLRRRPRGDTERSFIEKCEKLEASTPVDLWAGIYSEFNAKDFPSSRRITRHFRLAGALLIIVYWIVIAVIVLPQYFSGGV